MRGNESSENYLETIYMLSKKLPVVRSIDIAEEMNFSKPSVSVAMKHLREGGLVVTEPDGSLKLTAAGLAIAERVWERHNVLTSLFTRLGVSPEVARADACKIEHDLSQETFEKIKAWVATMDRSEG